MNVCDALKSIYYENDEHIIREVTPLLPSYILKSLGLYEEGSSLSMKKVRIEPRRTMVDGGSPLLGNSRTSLRYPRSLDTTAGCYHGY